MTTQDVFALPEFSGAPAAYPAWRRELVFQIPFAMKEMNEKSNTTAGKRLGLAIMLSVREAALAWILSDVKVDGKDKTRRELLCRGELDWFLEAADAHFINSSALAQAFFQARCEPDSIKEFLQEICSIMSAGGPSFYHALIRESVLRRLPLFMRTQLARVSRDQSFKELDQSFEELARVVNQLDNMEEFQLWLKGQKSSKAQDTDSVSVEATAARGGKQQSRPRFQGKCYYCKKGGHAEKNCFKKQRDESESHRVSVARESSYQR
jgi:hypothetical protein